jgi:hypothetical protein
MLANNNTVPALLAPYFHTILGCKRIDVHLFYSPDCAHLYAWHVLASLCASLHRSMSAGFGKTGIESHAGVPAVYPDSAFLPFLSFSAYWKINNLRGFNWWRWSESHLSAIIS